MLRKSLLICYDSSRIKTPVTEFPKCGYEHLLTRPCTVINESAQCAAHIWTMKLIYQPITLDRLIIAWSIIQVSNYVIASDVKCVPMFISFFVIFIVEIVMMGISWIHKNLDRCWNTCTNNPPMSFKTWTSTLSVGYVCGMATCADLISMELCTCCAKSPEDWPLEMNYFSSGCDLI